MLKPDFAQAAPSYSSDGASSSGRFAVLGPWSLSAGFPNGGSVWGSPALSIRNEWSEGEFVTVGLQLSSDKATRSDNFGVMGKWNHMMFTPVGRAFPYGFFQFGAQSQKKSENDSFETSLLAAFGVGVEVSLVREISTSFDTGFGGVFWPSNRLSYNAATTQISLHFHFQE